jgi:hypothetical protein
VVVADDAPLGVAVEAVDLFGGGAGGGAFLGVEGEFMDVVVAHGVPEFPFDEGLNEEG